MKCFGDYESIDLKTGIKRRRVTGDGESRLESDEETRIRKILEHSRKVVQPLIDEQRRAEIVPPELWDMRFR